MARQHDWLVLRHLDRRTWLLAVALTGVATAAIAIPTALIANDLFRRMTPTRPLDYVFLALAAPLTGLTGAIALRHRVGGEGACLTGGIATTLAVGCPICNKLVVALLGVSGALSVWAPLQPLLGATAVTLLVWTLRHQIAGASTPDPVDLAFADAPRTDG